MIQRTRGDVPPKDLRHETQIEHESCIATSRGVCPSQTGDGEASSPVCCPIRGASASSFCRTGFVGRDRRVRQPASRRPALYLGAGSCSCNGARPVAGPRSDRHCLAVVEQATPSASTRTPRPSVPHDSDGQWQARREVERFQFAGVRLASGQRCGFDVVAATILPGGSACGRTEAAETTVPPARNPFAGSGDPRNPTPYRLSDRGDTRGRDGMHPASRQSDSTRIASNHFRNGARGRATDRPHVRKARLVTVHLSCPAGTSQPVPDSILGVLL